MVSSSGDRTTQSSSTHLTRSLSASETWGFGFTGHLVWPSVAIAIHAALGSAAIFVWFPAILVGMLTIRQIKQLGSHWIDVAGGTPNYTTKLLKNYPGIARYAALGYFFSWVSTLPISAIVLTDLIRVNLEAIGLPCPELPLKVGFTLLTFVLAFSGTRALSILHLFFVLPAIAVLLAFCVQGISWLAFSPISPGFFPTSWSHLGFTDWAKWYFFASYAAYACETVSAYVADSRRPQQTLRFLPVAAGLMPPIFLGGAWVLTRLATEDNGNVFLSFVAAANPFWGSFTPLIVTFLIAAVSLLSCATVVSNCPRILYQLACDGHLSPVFSVVSKRGVFGPSLLLILLFSLLCLVWGDVAQIVAVSNVGWFTSFMGLRLGLWLQRGKPEVLFP
ncbi:MAG TPA: amino acid permease, partial [Phormidium sp.]